MKHNVVTFGLRVSLAVAYLSAVADRLGYWPQPVSVWGNWANFKSYTQLINPWFPSSWIEPLALGVSGLEVLLALGLLFGFKTRGCAIISGVLLLLFALAMTFSTGVKGAFDFSVFTAAFGSWALAKLKTDAWGLDYYLHKKL
ncbi:DoxX family protein [Sediminicola luteus]|uniref:DoxX family protein n=1 Tax=Sediminicola luteus TaxID=319238 RepID=A0A2A4G465_9FLAO|nr:DoxX family protein [Sediminicola luteus]PCE62768.1 hypothetical protein B7P33_15895 [Sediminicola luteus]